MSSSLFYRFSILCASLFTSDGSVLLKLLQILWFSWYSLLTIVQTKNGKKLLRVAAAAAAKEWEVQLENLLAIFWVYANMHRHSLTQSGWRLWIWIWTEHTGWVIVSSNLVQTCKWKSTRSTYIGYLNDKLNVTVVDIFKIEKPRT